MEDPDTEIDAYYGLDGSSDGTVEVQLIVSDSHGNTASPVTASIRVTPGEFSINLDPSSDLIFVAGDSASVKCEVQGGKPPYNYSWNASVFSVLGERKVTISADEGASGKRESIEVQVTDSEGRIRSASLSAACLGLSFAQAMSAPDGSQNIRLNVGIAEKTQLNLLPAGIGTPQWSASLGTITPNSRGINGATWNAGTTGGTCVVVATSEGKSVTKSFVVHLPSGITGTKRIGGSASNPSQAGYGYSYMDMILTVQPTFVSFYQLRIKEIDGGIHTESGYFDPGRWPAGKWHHETNPNYAVVDPSNQFSDEVGVFPGSIGATRTLAQFGQADGPNSILSSDPASGYIEGHLIWICQFKWKSGSVEGDIPVSYWQRADLYPSGVFILSKFGVTNP